jgi:hypothetical protein
VKFDIRLLRRISAPKIEEVRGVVSQFVLVLNKYYEPGYLRLEGRGSILCRDRHLSLLNSLEVHSEAHPASYPMGTASSLPQAKSAVASNYSPSIRCRGQEG